MCAPHRMRLGKTQVASSLSSLSVKNSMCFWLFFFGTRCATSVTRASRIMTPSITAVLVGRASVMVALPKLHPSLREDGVLPLSESVMSALNRELHMQVHPLKVMSHYSSSCFMLLFNIKVSISWAGVFFFYAEVLEAELEDEDGGNLARKVGEAVTNTIGVVVTAIDIPLGELCGKPKGYLLGSRHILPVSENIHWCSAL